MSHNPTPSDGDKSLNRPPNMRSETERAQLQYFNRQLQDIQPRSTSLQPRPNPVAGQYVGSYTSVNPASTSSTTQFGTMPTVYGSSSSMSASQHQLPTSMPTLTNQTMPLPIYSSHGNWPGNMAYGGQSAQTSSSYTYGQRHSSQNLGSMPAPQPNQWSAGQSGTTEIRETINHRPGMAIADFQSAAQSGILPASSSLQLPAATPIRRGSQNTSRSNPRTRGSSASSRGRSPASRGGVSRKPKPKTKSRAKSPIELTVASPTGAEPIKWRSGMKDRKITSDMTEEEKEAARDYNRRLAEAKKAHTREQNRVSAQKSRAKKIEQLLQTKSQVDELLEDNDQLKQLNTVLSTRIQELETTNMQLRAENDALRYRLGVYEQHIPVTIRNPLVALPQLGTSGQDQSQATQPQATIPPQSPRGQSVVNYSLPTTDIAQPTVGLGSPDPPLQAQQPSSTAPLDHPLPAQTQQQLNTLAGGAQEGDGIDWLVDLDKLNPPPGDDNPTWDPYLGGAQ
ncbi:hypothetical protein F5Y06DRAFT_304581 [Hypoxylon sp. FL0890]|nr:hypothetical protein F5Y06DRAFT_304581 [Hypoxylon sp. FL0890]